MRRLCPVLLFLDDDDATLSRPSMRQSTSYASALVASSIVTGSPKPSKGSRPKVAGQKPLRDKSRPLGPRENGLTGELGIGRGRCFRRWR